ncbi:MAG: response regulator [Bacteroidetes bacterium]|nr:response regulator [Bacteroidota bacterium]
MKKKILLVDDTPDIVENIREFLLMEDYQVLTALNGVEALAHLERERPDLIITDLVMPEMDGFELIQQLRSSEKYKQIPILVFSAKPIANEKLDELGANKFVLKPSPPEALLIAIDGLIKL